MNKIRFTMLSLSMASSSPIFCAGGPPNKTASVISSGENMNLSLCPASGLAPALPGPLEEPPLLVGLSLPAG